jgi:hypothetical protein
MPHGFSPQLFNIEIKKNIVENAHNISPINLLPLKRPHREERPIFKIKAMKAPKNYDPFSEIIKR